jgi:glycosyltransferase involved in cell wall biosynthesis/GT2 family glycosyltransferase
VLSVVVVAWNSADSVGDCLSALRRSAAAADVRLEIVVVDNASEDDSAAVALAAGADAVVTNPLNVGFVAAASQGIARAQSPWVMLANPDLTVLEGFVGAVVEAARSAPRDVASLVPDVRFEFDPSVVNSRGIEVDAVGIPAERASGRRAEPAESLEVFGASSSASILRVEALEVVGGLEPAYFAYLEDVDVAWRLRKRGYRALLVPGAVALHEGSASTGEGSWLKAYLVARNRRILFGLHGPRTAKARVLRSVTEIGHATVQALAGSGTAPIQGRLAALRVRSYERFLRASNAAIGIPDGARVALAPRVTLREALRRKQAATLLMAGRAGRVSPARPAALPADGSLPERPLRVLVDAANLKPGQGGIRTYTIGLIRALAERPELSLTVLTSLEEADELGPVEIVGLPARTRRAGARALWRERNLASLTRSLGADVVLTPVPELPARRLPVPTVVVVHDVGPLVIPGFYTWQKRLRYVAALRRTCRLATAVVCVSRATLADLQASTDIDPGRCVVIGEGPQLLHETGGRTDGEPYFLYVGSLDPRKNLETLLAIFDGADPPPARLVIAGPLDGEPSALADRFARPGAAGPVTHVGFVEPEALASLYRSARAVVLPSLYEGFGLPVLEAMAAGTPVVASDIPAVREVAGGAAHYVSSPLDPDAWRKALDRIHADEALRTDLVERGRRALPRFSWTEVAGRFSELLVRVAAEGAGARSPVRTAPKTAARRAP